MVLVIIGIDSAVGLHWLNIKTETKDSGDNKREGNNTEEKGGKIYTIEYLSILRKDHSPVKPLITTTDHQTKSPEEEDNESLKNLANKDSKETVRSLKSLDNKKQVIVLNR